MTIVFLVLVQELQDSFLISSSNGSLMAVKINFLCVSLFWGFLRKRSETYLFWSQDLAVKLKETLKHVWYSKTLNDVILYIISHPHWDSHTTLVKIYGMVVNSIFFLLVFLVLERLGISFKIRFSRFTVTYLWSGLYTRWIVYEMSWKTNQHSTVLGNYKGI